LESAIDIFGGIVKIEMNLMKKQEENSGDCDDFQKIVIYGARLKKNCNLCLWKKICGRAKKVLAEEFENGAGI